MSLRSFSSETQKGRRGVTPRSSGKVKQIALKKGEVGGWDMLCAQWKVTCVSQVICIERSASESADCKAVGCVGTRTNTDTLWVVSHLGEGERVYPVPFKILCLQFNQQCPALCLAVLHSGVRACVARDDVLYLGGSIGVDGDHVLNSLFDF